MGTRARRVVPLRRSRCEEPVRLVGLFVARPCGLPVRRRFARHQLRHAHAVEMAHEGVPLIVIQRQLGHSNLGTTSIYLQGIDNAEMIAAVRASRDADRKDQHHGPGFAQRQDSSRVGAGLQRPSRYDGRPDRGRRRIDQLLGRLRAARFTRRGCSPRVARRRHRAGAERGARRCRLLAPPADAGARRRRRHGPDPTGRQEAQREPGPAGTAASTPHATRALAAPAGGQLYRRRSSTTSPLSPPDTPRPRTAPASDGQPPRAAPLRNSHHG